MKLILLIGLACLLGARFLANPNRVVVVILGILVAIPATSTAQLTGRDYAVPGPLSLLPTTILVCGAATVGVLLFPWVIFRLRLPVAQTIGLVLVLGATMAATLTRRGGSGMGQFLDSLVGPIMLFLMIVVAHHIDSRMGQNLRMFLVVSGAFEALLGILQYLLSRPILFEADYVRQEWFQFMHRTAFRSMGTFDHPLTYALFMLLALSLALRLPHRALSIVLSALFVTAIAASASRSAILGAVLMMLMLAFVRRFKSRWVVFSVGLSAASLLILGPLGGTLAYRLSYDAGSSAARTRAAGLFVHILPSHVLVGSGLGSSELDAAQGGLRSSFESPLLILPIEIGLTMAALLLLIMVSFAVTRGPGRRWRPENYGTLIVLAVAMTYSSFGVKSEAGYVIWIALALPMIMPFLDKPFVGRKDDNRSEMRNSRLVAWPKSSDPRRVG